MTRQVCKLGPPKTRIFFADNTSKLQIDSKPINLDRIADLDEELRAEQEYQTAVCEEPAFEGIYTVFDLDEAIAVVMIHKQGHPFRYGIVAKHRQDAIKALKSYTSKN
jgi:hypothetical protein